MRTANEKIGKNCWNGYGGGIKKGETPTEAALRELKEEAGITASKENLEKAAIVDFHNTKSDGSVFVCRVHVYFAHAWTGEIRATEEMANPTWFDKNNLPLSDMMPADKEWLPVILAERKITAKAKYGPFQSKLKGKVEIKDVESFPLEQKLA